MQNLRSSTTPPPPVAGLGELGSRSGAQAEVKRSDAAKLSARAEAVLKAKNASAADGPECPEAMSPEACRTLIHELREQQTALDMQNDELRRALVDLEASRAHAMELYDLAPVGYFSLNDAGLILDANRTAEKHLGVSHCTLLHQPFQRFIAPEYHDFFHVLRSQSETTGEPQSCELRMVPGDGPPFWAQLVAALRPSPGHHDRGAPILRLVLRDIDARKAAEKMLSEKEERLALATLHNGIGIWDWNLVTREMVWDDSMFALYHIRRADFSGTAEAWRASLHPDDLARGDQEITAAITGEKPFDTVFRVVWPGGEVRHIKAVAKVFRDEQGHPLRMLGTNWDITARRQAEEAMRVANQTLRLLFEQGPMGCVEWDGQFCVRRWNPAAQTIFGFSAAEAMGRHASFIIPDASRDQVDEVLNALLDQRGGERSTNQNVHKDGVKIHCEWYNTPLIDPQGKLTGVASLVMDVTERIQAEAALRDANDKLEARVAERTAELSEANQELHRLLAALAVAEEGERRRIADGLHEDVLQRLCVVKMALFQPPGKQASKRFSAGICNAENELQIVMGLLRTLTFELASPVLKNLGLELALQSLCAQLEQQHGITFRFEREERPSALAPDVEIIFFNAVRQLLSNVVLHAHARNVLVAIQRNSGWFELSVEDDGTGFDSAPQTKGFSPTGGYGLFNIRNRMKHLRGELRITPTSPCGTRIVLAVPLGDAATPQKLLRE